MPDRLAFVEKPGQLAHVPEGYTPISTSPVVDVSGELERPEDHVGGWEVEELGDRNFERVEELCALLDAAAARETGDSRLRLGRWHVFELKRMMDALLVRALHVERVVRAHAAPEVACFPGGLYADAIWAVAQPVGFEVTPLDAPPEPDLFRSVSGGGTRETLVRLARHRGRGIGARLRGPRRRGPTVLCLDFDYGVPDIARELVARGFRTWIWAYADFLHELGSLRTARAPTPIARGVEGAALWRRVEEEEEEVRALFRDSELDVWRTARRRLRSIVETSFPAALAAHDRAAAVLERLQPQITLLSVATYPHQKAACAAAAQRGIPTAFTRHGEIGIRDVRMVHYEDVDAVDWALAWGRFEAEWTERSSRHGTRAVPVGSPTVEAAVRSAPPRTEIRRRLGVSDDELVVLLVPTNLSGDGWYASTRTPTDGGYFEHVRRILEALLQIPDATVIVKEHPGILDSPIERWLAGRARVIREPAFPDLIHLADAMVLDTPSTTLVQGIFGSSRIYLTCHPYTRWVPAALEHFEEHGLPLCDGPEVAKLIQADAGVGRLREPAGYPDEAIEPFAAGGRRGGAAGRAAEAVARVAVGAAAPG